MLLSDHNSSTIAWEKNGSIFSAAGYTDTGLVIYNSMIAY